MTEDVTDNTKKTKQNKKNMFSSGTRNNRLLCHAVFYKGQVRYIQHHLMVRKDTANMADIHVSSLMSHLSYSVKAAHRAS